MIKRTLFFGNPVYLSTRNDQLLIRYPDGARPEVKVPIEDIGVVVLESLQITLSHHLISRLLANNVAIVTCDEKHHPQGLIFNLSGHHLQTERYRKQIGSSLPLKKRLWAQTIVAKIHNQANLLEKMGRGSAQLRRWAGEVKTGDRTNLEARAARYYWENLFCEAVPGFTRGRFNAEPNNLLNYCYAILRAAMARCLVGAGLLPTLGINHHNKYNAYCLADDIMEPYRPYADELVGELLKDTDTDLYILDTHIKARLLNILARDVKISDQVSPLMIALQRTANSLVACFEGTQQEIAYPILS